VTRLLGGQRLSLADYVALTEAHGRDACRRRGLMSVSLPQPTRSSRDEGAPDATF
jgi:hypothetical protein